MTSCAEPLGVDREKPLGVDCVCAWRILCMSPVTKSLMSDLGDGNTGFVRHSVRGVDRDPALEGAAASRCRPQIPALTSLGCCLCGDGGRREGLSATTGHAVSSAGPHDFLREGFAKRCVLPCKPRVQSTSFVIMSL